MSKTAKKSFAPPTPAIPPPPEMTIDSATNMATTCAGRKPRVLSTAISCVRSRTAIDIVFVATSTMAKTTAAAMKLMKRATLPSIEAKPRTKSFSDSVRVGTSELRKRSSISRAIAADDDQRFARLFVEAGEPLVGADDVDAGHAPQPLPVGQRQRHRQRDAAARDEPARRLLGHQRVALDLDGEGAQADEEEKGDGDAQRGEDGAAAIAERVLEDEPKQPHPRSILNDPVLGEKGRGG